MGKKWNDSRPAEKLLSFYTMLLFSRAPISLSEAAESLECSKQTVGRLADQLEGARYGKLNKSKVGKEVYYNIDKPRRVPAINLNADALAELVLCHEFIQKLLPPAMLKKARQSLNQAAAFLEDPSAGIRDGIGSALVKGLIDYAPFEEILRTFMIAIAERRICRVCYRAKRHLEEKTYEFAPKRLIAFHESIFVLGYIMSPEEPLKPLYPRATLLALHRFLSCQITRLKSDGAPEPEIREQSFFGVFDDNKFPIKILFKASAATYVAERRWSGNQRIEELPNNDIILYAEAGNEKECVSWILSFGANAELLQPAWLREKIKETLADMNRVYGMESGSGGGDEEQRD